MHPFCKYDQKYPIIFLYRYYGSTECEKDKCMKKQDKRESTNIFAVKKNP